MCLATAVMIAGTALSAFGAIQQGRAAAATGEYNAQVASANARASRQAAAADADRMQRDAMRLAGAQRVAIGASGIDTAGTPGDVMAASRAEAATDVMTRLYRGQVEGVAYENEGRQARFAGRQARQASYINAGRAILSGASNLYSTYGSGMGFGNSQAKTLGGG